MRYYDLIWFNEILWFMTPRLSFHLLTSLSTSSPLSPPPHLSFHRLTSLSTASPLFPPPHLSFHRLTSLSTASPFFPPPHLSFHHLTFLSTSSPLSPPPHLSFHHVTSLSTASPLFPPPHLSFHSRCLCSQFLFLPPQVLCRPLLLVPAHAKGKVRGVPVVIVFYPCILQEFTIMQYNYLYFREQCATELMVCCIDWRIKPYIVLTKGNKTMVLSQI